jgi:hypothetical protein
MIRSAFESGRMSLYNLHKCLWTVAVLVIADAANKLRGRGGEVEKARRRREEGEKKARRRREKGKKKARRRKQVIGRVHCVFSNFPK